MQPDTYMVYVRFCSLNGLKEANIYVNFLVACTCTIRTGRPAGEVHQQGANQWVWYMHVSILDEVVFSFARARFRDGSRVDGASLRMSWTNFSPGARHGEVLEA
jgi:hypothetical protein